MASALSPTSSAAAKDSGPVTRKEFDEYIKYYQQSHKAIVRLTALVNRLPANQALKIGGHALRRSDISKYSQAYIAQLSDLRKMYARKRKTNRSNVQLNQLFYVSDQLVKFYTGAKLGPADPENPRGRKLASEIDLLTKHHMSTSGILTSLISRYIDTNDLKTSGQPQRFKPDAKMKDCLSSTNYVLFGEDLSDREIPPSTRPEKADKIRDNISLGKKSAFARVNGRVDSRSGEAFFNPKSGLLYTTMMVFNNYYRIPNELLTDDERSALTDKDNQEEAKQLQSTLTSITRTKNKK